MLRKSLSYKICSGFNKECCDKIPLLKEHCNIFRALNVDYKDLEKLRRSVYLKFLGNGKKFKNWFKRRKIWL